MREAVTEPRLREFMRAIAKEAREPGRIYLTGGASAVLRGWRSSTLDIDIAVVPENDRILRAIPELKELLHVNVELASPADFVPPLPGWEDRSPFIAREGTIAFHHFDFYTQALAKIERGHRKDLGDVDSMIRDQLVNPGRLGDLFAQIERELYRYPAIDPATLRSAVSRVTSR
jgi:predicted nucleotidyltransferase